MNTILYLVAVILFVLAALGVAVTHLGLIPLGLAFFAAAHIAP